MRENAFLAKRLLPDLYKEEAPKRAVQRHERATGDKSTKSPERVADIYLERLGKVFLNPDERVRERNIALLKPKLHNELVLKRGDFPESYFELQNRIRRERGEAVVDMPIADREQTKDILIEDQTKRLDDWVDYLASDDAVYPPWFKYFAFRNVTKLSQFDKEAGEFKKRTKTTTTSFPEIDREALARLCDKYVALAHGDTSKFEDDAAFREFASKKFGDLYAAEMVRSLESTQERSTGTAGLWKKYARGDMSQANALYESLQGKNTGWCTAGKATAETQVQNGDFHVYYTYADKQEEDVGTPTEPRIAIRMSGNHIGEVRGVLGGQELEPILADVLDEKLKEFGTEADAYRKKTADMKHLTRIDAAMGKGETLSTEDLAFLYELDSRIEGFGYTRDPRIAEIKNQRNAEVDTMAMLAPLDKAGKIQMVAEHPNIFLAHHAALEGIDRQQLVDEMVESGTGAAAIVRYLEEFAELDQEKLVRQLSVKWPETVLERFEKFDKIDQQKFVDSLVEAGEDYALIRNASHMTGVDRAALARRLLKKDTHNVVPVAGYLDSFPGLSADEVLETFVGTEAEKLHFIGNHTATFLPRIEEIHSVDHQKIVDTLVKQGRLEALFENLQHFSNVDTTELVRELINGNSRQVDSLKRHLHRFDPLPLDLALTYLDKAGAREYVNDYRSFTHLDPNVVIPHLLEKDKDSFIWNLKQYGTYAMNEWHGVNEDILKKLMDAEVSEYMLARHHHMFEPRAERALYERIQVDNKKFPSNYVATSNFETLTLQERYNLIENSDIELDALVLSFDLDRGTGRELRGLDARIAGKIIDAHRGYVIGRNIKSFQTADHDAIARQLIKAKSSSALLDAYHDFKNLSIPVLRRLRNLMKEKNLHNNFEDMMREREPNAVRRFLTRF